MKFSPNEESQKFWEAFRACTEENRVSPDRSSFYVRWAQAFARFLPEKLLQDRSGKDIQAFLATGRAFRSKVRQIFSSPKKSIQNYSLSCFIVNRKYRGEHSYRSDEKSVGD